MLHQKARYGDVPISVIQDGAPELWNLVGEMCTKHHVTPRFELIDRFHVDERLAAVCEAVSGDVWSAQLLREAWRIQLDRSDTAIDRIVRRIDELLTHLACGATDGEPMPGFWKRRARSTISNDAIRVLGENIEYFRNNRARLRYASSRFGRLPVGSGPTEGACKSVIAMRFKRSGQRWFETGLAPCLSLRALHLSERLRACFDYVQATRFATLEAA